MESTRNEASPPGGKREGSSRGAFVRHALSLLTAALLVFGVFSACDVAFAEPRTVRVGIYENEPKVFTDEEGEPAGIFVDLLEAIAAEEEWNLVYVSGEWSEGLSALERGDIDLMPDMAYTEARDLSFDFHEHPVVESWSYVYAAPGQRIERLSELDGKSVAVLRGSVQETIFRQMTAGFGLDVALVEVGSLNEAFELASSGQADAAIANYLFGDYSFQRYGLRKTPIVFNAVPLHFATAEGRNADLLATIDTHLSAWVQEPESEYYQILNRYTSQGETRVPQELVWALFAAGGLLAFATAAILVLRWQVNLRTRHLLQAQAELQDHRDMLEQIVQERTECLEQANLELHAANQAKSRFLARMSHELRTPLNSIIGFSEVMLMGLTGELNEEQRRQSEMINRSGKHLLQLINDILDLSKVEAGGLELAFASFDPAALVADVEDTVRIQADERGLSLVMEVPETPLSVTSDERTIRQILLNLVGNALKFTQSGSVTIRVEPREDTVVFAVQDTGPGIPAEDIEHIFDEFWQVTPHDGSQPQGTGLGLAISWQMAELLGGSLTVESEPGAGSTFTLALPTDLSGECSISPGTVRRSLESRRASTEPSPRGSSRT